MRKIIFKCRTGSHLHGTNTLTSDEDFTGIFLPSKEDLMGLQNCPTEWTDNVKLSTGERNEAGDIDCKYYSLKRFLGLAAEGQPAQLEMLFAPESAIITSTPEWETIKSYRHIFLAKSSIKPFVGFAVSQTHKATIKGENLNHIRDLIKWGESITKGIYSSLGNKPLMDFLDVVSGLEGYWRVKNTNINVKALANPMGALLTEVAGRQYDINLALKTFVSKLKDLELRYGTRSETAAEDGYDWKSLYNAYRLVLEAKYLLSTGNIPLPLPEAPWLLKIKMKEDKETDHLTKLENMLTELRAIESELPDSPDRSAINYLCIRLHLDHIKQHFICFSPS